jgi:imidazole glycerol phosphate synthase glutamine amidotransferase subunit
VSEAVVVRTGTANLASVLAGLRRAGAEPRFAESARDVAEARRVVLPGVGAFAAAMRQLETDGLVEALATRITAGRPTLAVCLGLQLLCEESDESPGARGLGVLPIRVGKYSDAVRVPQLGWNEVTPSEGCRLLEPGFAYFANSYRLAETPLGWSAALSEHDGPFVAAIEQGPVLACQFHPELSGGWGLCLLRRWMESTEC